MFTLPVLILAGLSAMGVSASAAAPDFARELNAATFDGFASAASGVLQSGRAMKFFIDRRGASPQIYFINGSLPGDEHRFHYYFGKRFAGVTQDAEAFNRATYFNSTLAERKFVAGTLQTYELTSPGHAPELIHGLQFYPQDLIQGDMILEVARIVRAAIHEPAWKLAFVQFGAQQRLSDAQVATLRDQHGIAATTIERVLGSTRYIPMNAGEAWGVLRVYPTSAEDLLPQDIPIFKELPLDLSVVAATATFDIQNPGSHINLKSKERGTPNFVLHDEAEIAALRQKWEGRPIHLVVTPQGYRISASTTAEVEAHLQQHLQGPWKPIAPFTRRDIVFYDQMCPNKPALCIESVPEYGGKAAKLGFLNHPKVLGFTAGSWSRTAGYDYPLTSDGFGIPIAFYWDLLAANPSLKAEIEALVALEKQFALSSNERKARVEAIQRHFYAAQVPASMIAALESARGTLVERMRALNPDFPGLKPTKKFKVKMRSSANVEDIPEFDGAGLHESYGANLNLPLGQDPECHFVAEVGPDAVETKGKMVPETMTCAIKGVYASLWNKRAIEERSFKHIDHATAAMGIAVVSGYNTLEYKGLGETGNTVVLTRILGKDLYGDTVTSQKGENLVTNPTPNTQAEVALVLGLGPSEPVTVTYTQFAKPEPNGPVRTEPVFSQPFLLKMVQVAQHVERQYCRAKRGYTNHPSVEHPDCDWVLYDNDKPKSLDMEFKVLGNEERLLCKQMREFAGR